MSRGSRVLVAAVLAVPMVGLGQVSPAMALHVVAVTTTSDVVNGGDGVVSLREAFTIANSDGDDTQITLVADALYRLCDVVTTATDEDANIDGDLDHTAANALTIIGNGAEIRTACPGERVAHQVNTDGSIALGDLLVAGGDLGVGEPGSALLSAGDVSIDNVTFTDNTGGPAVEVGELGSGGVTVSVTDSRFSDNGGGIRVNGSASTISDTEFVGNQGAAVTIDRGSSTITNVLARENTRGIHGIDGTISVTGSHVRDNSGYASATRATRRPACR